MTHAAPASFQWARWGRITAIVLAVLVLALVLLAVFFPWDLLRGPINRYVSEKTGRTFEITERLEVHPGRTMGIVLHGVRFANPAWARDPQLVEADKVELDIALWPLLRRELVLPRLHLYRPRIAMQLEPDGRRSWAFGKDTGDASTVPTIGEVRVDGGELKYLAVGQGADVKLAFDYDAAQGQLPVKYQASGTWKKLPFSAEGRAGNVLQLNEAGAPPFPVQVSAQTGKTFFKADGTIARIADFEGVDAAVELRGATLGDLFPLLGVSLPQTSPYALKARLGKQGDQWKVAGLQGRLGSSDLGGDLSYDGGQAVPVLTGQIRSRVLDMDDLGPLIGLKPRTTTIPASADAPVVASSAKAEVAQPSARGPAGARKVLPTAPLDFARLRAMNADVTYVATSIRHFQEVPLEKGSVRVQLKDSVLRLDPLDLSVAGGRMQGRVRIDGQASPADVATTLDIRGVQLGKLFPTIERLNSSVGGLSGAIDLRGRGNSVAQWLGDASGGVQLAMGQGHLSNLLLEIVGLDGGEILRFFVEGDRDIRLRCAVADFGLKSGQATARTFVFDTSDTVIYGEGGVDLKEERMDFVLRPQPKDRSILSLRTPLKVGGTFAAPSAFPDKAALAGRAGLALALGAINPLLALAATIETGPGEDTDCARTLASVGSKAPVAGPKAQSSRPAAAASRPAGSPAR